MNFYTAVGNLTSPNFPEPPNHREECYYFIKVAETESIRLVVNVFNTETNKDILEIGAGPEILEKSATNLTGDLNHLPIDND